jgi:hypothetical protein
MDSSTAPRTRPLFLNLSLAATTLLSAWLLFQVQPMVGRRILPWFGGGATVWTTTMLFFQTALFFGYLYAHWLGKYLAARTQLAAHGLLLAVAAALVFFIGVLPPDSWQPQASQRPTLSILTMLAASVGLPYLMLAATAPLVQVWFARANPGRSPYRLYAISNFGSLAALLSYPLAVEPNVGLQRQGVYWSVLFLAFAGVCALSGFMSLRRSAALNPVEPLPPERLHLPHDVDSSPPRYGLWLALPACTSLLLLSITTYISQNVAPIPLLWVLPLAAYLLSFILTFDSDRWYRRWLWMPLAAALSFAAVFTWQSDRTPQMALMAGLHIALLFAASMVCHGELARLRPPARSLTAFYLCIAAGGALGGLFTSVLAPLILPDQWEVHLGLLFAWLLAIAVLATDRHSPFYDGGKRGAFGGFIATLALLVGLVIALGVHVRMQMTKTVGHARNFYGVLHLVEKGDVGTEFLELTNGHIAHGGQFLDPTNRRVPTWYYHAESGVGHALLSLKKQPPRRIGVVGLGTGTMATYAEAGDEIQFYEINPQVADIAERRFTYLADARQRGAKVAINEGDARLSFEQQPPQRFDVLVLDAFNGDAIPVHLLTTEAMELYLGHLDEHGILAVHISNVYLNLQAVVLAAANRFKLDGVVYRTPADMSLGAGGATWVLLHRQQGYFADHPFGDQAYAGPLVDKSLKQPAVEWTDDYSNVLEILKW